MMFIARSVHPQPGEAERRERLLSLIDGFSSRRVLVVGDIIADEFIYGEVARVSREAPVLILKYDATEMVAGGAGNAANNVAALGGRARLMGVVGADPEARRLLASFHRGVDRSFIVRAREYRTPVKTRILAGGIHSAKQQIVRIDRAAGCAVDRRGESRVHRKNRVRAGRVRRRGAVRLRIGPGDAGARGSRAPGPGTALATAAGPCSGRFTLSTARLPWIHRPARRTNPKSSRWSASG